MTVIEAPVPLRSHGHFAEGSRIEPQQRISTAWLLAIVFGGAFVTRVIALGSFPAIKADEGLWTRSTKNYVLFGDWFLDRHTHLFLSPLFHLLSIPLFRLLGPTIVAGRLVSALAGTLSVWLLYVLVRRVTLQPRIALISAMILACSEWGILQSREALIESLEVCVILACATVLTFEGMLALVGGGVLFGLLLLTKINAIFMAAPIAYLVMMSSTRSGNPLTSPRAWLSASIVGLTGALIAGAGYYLLYRTHPADFFGAFKYELDGVHFESGSHPLVRIGRFGIDPVQVGRTIIALFREEPILLTFTTIGVAILPWVRTRGVSFFATWLFVGAVFFFAQMYQPIRYFYLLMPGIVCFAAVFLDWLARPMGQSSPTSRRVAYAATSAFLAFDLMYTAMNAVANRNNWFTDVHGWLQANTNPRDRLMVSAMLATDVPNPAYAYYRVVHGPEDLDPVIRQLHIRYVVTDDAEWPREYCAVVDRLYAKRFTGAHSIVYEVGLKTALQPEPPGPRQR
ncbi:MAG: ArnT family glycosyltransferase [Gemmatimonadaceae bacterium]